MTYDEQYDIYHGIFMTFDKNSKKKTMAVRHGQKKRDEVKAMFPWRQYEHYTKSVFILACLYVNFVKMPSSAISGIQDLANTSMHDIQLFKDSIIQYKKYLKDDLNKLSQQFGTNVKFDDITNAYRQGEVKWYTWYFYLSVSGQDVNKLERSRINGLLYKKIKSLLLFVSFSQESMLLTKKIMSDNLSFA